MYVWGMKTIIENNFMAWHKQSDVLNETTPSLHTKPKELITDKKLPHVVK